MNKTTKPLNHLMAFTLIITAGVLGFGGSVGAQVILGVSQSSISNGDSVVINGVSFGTKPHAAPLKWDNFETGTNGEEITGWSNVVGETNHLGDELIPRYSNNNLRTGQGLNYQVTLGPNDESTGCYITEHSAPFTKAFVSFWLRFS